MVIKVSEKAMDWLAERGYDPQFGARPMKRVLQQDLVDGLSRELIAGTFTAGDTIYVDLGDGELSFSTDPYPAASDEPTEPKAPEAQNDNGGGGRKRRRSKKNREDQLDELKKATDDLNEAVAKVKEDEGPQTETE